MISTLSPHARALGARRVMTEGEHGVPPGIYEVELIGGGGGGGAYDALYSWYGERGYSGYHYTVMRALSGDNLFDLGAGGARGYASYSDDGERGDTTSITKEGLNVVSATGGRGGKSGAYTQAQSSSISSPDVSPYSLGSSIGRGGYGATSSSQNAGSGNTGGINIKLVG